MTMLSTPRLLGLSPLVLAGAVAAQQQWAPLGEVPRTVRWPVYDTARDRVVVFGEDYQSIDDPIRAFEWNGRWQPHQPAMDSGLATIAGTVFDRSRGQALVIGAPSVFGSQPLQTGIYEGGRFRTPVPGVPVRPGAGFVHDAARGEVLAFGGSGTGLFSVVDSMWRWSGSAWSQVSQPSLRPPPRKGPALVYDPLRQQVVLFGGSDGVSNPMGDTWTWDGQVWQQAAAAGPAPRERAGFAFDPVSGSCLLHGGYVRDQEVAGTWQWDGTAWTQVAVTNPPGSGWLVETAGRPLLLRENQSNDNGTYRWNGAGFDRVAPPQNALARYETDMVYDAARGDLVLFGGQPVAGGTWLWNGAWRQVALSPSGPVGRRRHSMVYDAQRRQVVLFGGQDADVGGSPLGDTWTWDGATWTRHQTANAPIPRFEAGFAYDAARGQCVLFGGHSYSQGTLADTWIWDGSTWMQAQPGVSPSPRWNPQMAYDEARQRVVMLNGMIGGSTIPETWEWDGSTWLQRNPAAQPGGPIGYDRQRGRVLAVTSYGAIHAWDGNEWQPVPVLTPPGSRPVPLALAWHDRLDRLVLYSGGPGTQTLWALTATPPLAEVFADACPPGTTNDCDFLALGLPRLGNAGLEIDLRGAAANAPGAVVWGLAPGRFPTAGGCAALVDAPFRAELAFTNAGGYGRLRTPVPDIPVLLGGRLYLQGFVLDGQGPIGGASASAGLRLTLGR